MFLRSSDLFVRPVSGERAEEVSGKRSRLRAVDVAARYRRQVGATTTREYVGASALMGHTIGTTSAPDDVAVFKQNLRDALRAAMKARDTAVVGALRSALAAIDNAEAADLREVPVEASGWIAGAATGLGAAEVERRHLTTADVVGIVRDEVTERLTAAEEYMRLGQGDEANRLQNEAAVLWAALGAEDLDV